MNKADLGANIAREWIDRNNVEAIIDVPNSSVALAVRNVVQQANKVILVSGASSSDLTGKSCSPNSSIGPTIPMRFQRHRAGGGRRVAARAGTP